MHRAYNKLTDRLARVTTSGRRIRELDGLRLSNPSRRIDLARKAIRVGREYFSHEAAFGKFVSKICAGGNHG